MIHYHVITTHEPPSALTSRPPHLPPVAEGDTMSLAVKYMPGVTLRKPIFHPSGPVVSDGTMGTLWGH